MKNLFAVLFLSLCVLACSKDKVAEKRSPYYFDASIEGAKVIFKSNNENSVYVTGTNFPSNSSGNATDQYYLTMLQNPLTADTNQVEVGLLQHFIGEPTLEQKKTMLRTGSFSFGSGKLTNETVNGAVVRYFDNNGTYWTSEGGSQEGSTFTITELADHLQEGEENARVAVITFSCNLYNEDGNILKVTNANMRSVFLLF